MIRLLKVKFAAKTEEVRCEDLGSIYILKVTINVQSMQINESRTTLMQQSK